MLESRDPATGEVISSVTETEPGAVQAVVADAAFVQPFWADLPLAARARYLRRAAQVVLDNLDELARLIARERGMPLTETLSLELLPSVHGLRWIADQGEKVLADERVAPGQPVLLHKRSRVVNEPLGVVAIITSFAHPWSVPMLEAATALMCGNAVVIKPAALTPLTGDRVQAVLERAGVPRGLVRMVHGGRPVGDALVGSGVAKVFFAGATAEGREVGRACAGAGKGAVLQLSGKDAQVVLADAPLDHAVAGGLWGAFAGGGQTGFSIERVYVLSAVAERFTDALVEGAERLRLGGPGHWDTEIGPLASPDDGPRLEALLDEAVAAGATLRCGGPRVVKGVSGSFFAPAVLTGVPAHTRLAREETFGPMVCVTPVDSEEDALSLMADSPYGRAASVWTADRARGERMGRLIAAGSVWVNDHGFSHGSVEFPWSGTKDSGFGRSRSRVGFLEYVRVKHLSWDPSFGRNPWWHPYDEALGEAMRAYAQLLHGRDADKREALRRGAAPLARVAQRSLKGLIGAPRGARR